jgi:hypothetical protein
MRDKQEHITPSHFGQYLSDLNVHFRQAQRYVYNGKRTKCVRGYSGQADAKRSRLRLVGLLCSLHIDAVFRHQSLSPPLFITRGVDACKSQLVVQIVIKRQFLPRPSPNCSIVSDSGRLRIFLAVSLRSTSSSSVSAEVVPLIPLVNLYAVRTVEKAAPAPSIKGRLRPVCRQYSPLDFQRYTLATPTPHPATKPAMASL